LVGIVIGMPDGEQMVLVASLQLDPLIRAAIAR
jgi:hypothetical protein